MYSSTSCLVQRKVDNYNQLKFREIHINVIFSNNSIQTNFEFWLDKTCLKVLKKIKNGLKNEHL